MMAVNLGGVWNATKVVAPAMRRAGGGSIVNVSSDAVLSGIPGLAHYVASKGAVTSLTRVLASELGKDRVRVNALAVGFTETPAALAHGSEAAGRSVERRALSRPQVVDDVVGTVSWLLSPDSAFVTGQLIAVNGGYVFH
jgi:NAD(P)-dependent dehydrogenase (short-subunit alcohol dehydrogenase family)